MRNVWCCLRKGGAAVGLILTDPVLKDRNSPQKQERDRE